MSGQFTPTTEDIRSAWVLNQGGDDDPFGGIAAGEFDRWLERHDARARADQILRDAGVVRSVADARLIGKYMNEAIALLLDSRATLLVPNESAS